MREQRTAMRWWAGIFLGLGLGLLTAGMVLASGGEAAHGGGHGISESMKTDFIWRTVNFLVFAAILIKLVSKPAKAFFAKRSSDIGETLAELEAQKAESEAALKAAQARLAEVGAEREKLMEQFLAEGEAEKAKIIDKANQVAARIKDMAAHSIDQEFKKASLELKQEVAEQATRMAEELVKKEITFADQMTLVEEYLQKVVEKH